VIAWATQNGWTLDRWSQLKKEFDNRTHRLKLSRIAVRHEAIGLETHDDNLLHGS
jgi:hypothetical protein